MYGAVDTSDTVHSGNITRQWCTADSAPGTPCTKDPSSLGAHDTYDATNITRQKHIISLRTTTQ